MPSKNAPAAFSSDELDERFMMEAIRLAEENLKSNKGGPVGAVIVLDGKVMGKSANESFLTSDPTAHAEMQAIRKACRKLKTLDLSGTVIYTNCEPCPMCLGAIYWAKIEKIYYAASKEDTYTIGFDDKVIFREFTKADDQKEIPRIQIIKAKALPALQKWKEIGESRINAFEAGSRKAEV